jgi:hypothetical protein
MSAPEVRTLFPTAQPIREPDPSRPRWIALLRSDKAVIDGLRQTVRFTFDDGRLVSVVTSAGGQPDPTALSPEDVRQAQAALQAQYGPPVRCKGPDSNALLACFWHANGLFIGFMGRADPLPMFLTFHHPWESKDETLLR